MTLPAFVTGDYGTWSQIGRTATVIPFPTPPQPPSSPTPRKRKTRQPQPIVFAIGQRVEYRRVRHYAATKIATWYLGIVEAVVGERYLVRENGVPFTYGASDLRLATPNATPFTGKTRRLA